MKRQHLLGPSINIEIKERPSDDNVGQYEAFDFANVAIDQQPDMCISQVIAWRIQSIVKTAGEKYEKNTRSRQCYPLSGARGMFAIAA